jgi:branched-chain amino acid transport system permease protein
MLQVLLSGLSIGAVYGLVAMAFAIVFYVTRVINFATGQVLVVAVMVAAALDRAGQPTVVVILGGLLSSTVTGVVVYALAVRPVLAFDRFSFAWLVSTLGVAIVLESGAAMVWGPTSRGFPALLNHRNLRFGEESITWQQAAAILIALLAAATFEILRRRTLLGKLGMAISADPEMAEAIGARVTRFAVGAFAAGGFLAGVAGILIGPITYSNPYLGGTYGIFGFVALMIGGLQKPVGALVGGLLLGVLTVGANTWISSQASDWFPFLVVVAVLLVAPDGLFSRSRLLDGITAALRRPRQATEVGS